MGKHRTGGMTTIGILNIIFGTLFSLVFLLMILGAGFMAAAGSAMGGEDGAAVAAGGGFLMLVGIAAFAINLMLFISGIGVLKVASVGPHPERCLRRPRRDRVQRIARCGRLLDPDAWHAGLLRRPDRPLLHAEVEDRLLLLRERAAAHGFRAGHARGAARGRAGGIGVRRDSRSRVRRETP